MGQDVEFYDHFQANGWMTGKVPMKDWQAAARNWSRNETKYGRSTVNERPLRSGPTDAEKAEADRLAKAQHQVAVELAELDRMRKERGL
jgi:hypothetical protein